MSDLKINQQRISKCLDSIIDASKTRTLKINEEKNAIKILEKELDCFNREAKSTKRSKGKVHIKQNVSQELSNFFGVSPSIKMSKSDVMQLICTYIEKNELRSDDNRRLFVTNKELSKLFGVKLKTKLYTIEIMKHIHSHFIDDPLKK
jgi:chromatin remodeling complex protein RSC6